LKIIRLLALACAGTLIVLQGLAPRALAGTATANLSVSTDVSSSCSISAASLSFPDYTGALDQGSTTVTVTCNVSSGLSPYLTLNTNSVGQRNLVDGTATLPYTLCEDAACSMPITSSIHYAMSYSTSGTTNAVYGEIPASETVSASGSYSDTVTMTLNF
jgi:spore coat protein U-like protein